MNKITANHLEYFLKNIKAVKLSFDLIIPLLEKQRKQEVLKIDKLLETKARKKRGGGYIIKEEGMREFIKILDNVEIAHSARTILPESSLSLLVSQFDTLVSAFIRDILTSTPGILESSEKTLKYSELLKNKSIKSVKSLLIEKEVDSIIRDNHNYHFQWIESKIGVNNIIDDHNLFLKFIEITERRNIVIHNNSIVNDYYLNNCKKLKLPIELKLNDKVKVTPQYILDAYYCFFKVGIRLTYQIYKKLYPQKLDALDEEISNICYKLIVNKELELASSILDFIIKQKISPRALIICTINKALILKMERKEVEVKKIISSQDWSNLQDEFKLAKAVIVDDKDNALLLMKKIGKNSDLFRKSDYREFPLFYKISKSKKFREMFKVIFKEDYCIKEQSIPKNYKKPK